VFKNRKQLIVQNTALSSGFGPCGFVNKNDSEGLGSTLFIEVIALLTNCGLSYPRTHVYSTAVRTFCMRH